MAYPRYLKVPPGVSGLYHCSSRCVRRAYLCGEDALTGRSYAHRKQWLERRLLELSELYAVALHAYAIMSNHLHVVVEVEPSAVGGWSDEEVARRWLSASMSTKAARAPLEERVAALVAQPERVAELRERLGSLSWFMRHLKEPIARRANREDGVTGHFWEGRFDTQDLLTDAAVLGCMVYVDLNPVRAGLASTPEAGRHTSFRRRVGAARPLHEPLTAVAGGIEGRRLSLSTGQYLSLVDWTGRALRAGARGVIASQAPPILERLEMSAPMWLVQVPATESGYGRAIGSAAALREHARRLGQRWVKGIGTATRIERTSRRH